MVGNLKNKIYCFLLVLLSGMLLAGCAERMSEQLVLPDSTIVYPAKDSNDISATITLSRYFGQKTGRQWGITEVFPIKDDENVYAVVELGNRMKNIDRELLFHLDWLRPDGKSVYMKETLLPAGDSAFRLESAVSSAPGSRKPGKYSLRVYLFRELIAEKYFELKNEGEIGKISGDIIFFKSMDKETGEIKGEDTVFVIKKKGILRAQVSLKNLNIYKDEELPVRLEWIGPDGESFYSKKSEIKPSDTLSVVNGSISITPDKREPGIYSLRVLWFDEIVAEKKFELILSDS